MIRNYNCKKMFRTLTCQLAKNTNDNNVMNRIQLTAIFTPQTTHISIAATLRGLKTVEPRGMTQAASVYVT